MSSRHGADPGERRGGRQPGSKNKATLEHENLISRAMGKLDRPLGKEVLAEVMVEFREMAKEQAEAARAGDKEAQQKRVYYQGTLETDKADYWSPAFASRARGMPGSRKNHYRYLSECHYTGQLHGVVPLISGRSGRRGFRTRIVPPPAATPVALSSTPGPPSRSRCLPPHQR